MSDDISDYESEYGYRARDEVRYRAHLGPLPLPWHRTRVTVATREYKPGMYMRNVKRQHWGMRTITVTLPDQEA